LTVFVSIFAVAALTLFIPFLLNVCPSGLLDKVFVTTNICTTYEIAGCPTVFAKRARKVGRPARWQSAFPDAP
jgi:hypothetical protein